MVCFDNGKHELEGNIIININNIIIKMILNLIIGG